MGKSRGERARGEEETERMNKETIRLPDGRYLIFYDFVPPAREREKSPPGLKGGKA